MSATLNRRFLRSLGGWRWVEVLPRDTLPAIALRELGDAARWTDIQAINDLLPPYIVAAPDPANTRVRAWGQFLRVPAGQVETPRATDPEAALGTDLALPGGRLTDNGLGDFAVVAGRANLRAAVARRLGVEEGELPFHPGFGSRLKRLVGRVAGPTAALLAARYAREALAADPRVKAITAATAEVQGDRIAVRVELVPITGGTVVVEETF